MANTINEVANVYTYKREVAKTDAPSPLPVEKGEKTSTEDRKAAAQTSEELVSRIEKLPQMVQRNLEFSVDEQTGKQVVRVIDSDTKELVRRIPPEQILRIIRHMEELQGKAVTGVLLDDSV